MSDSAKLLAIAACGATATIYFGPIILGFIGFKATGIAAGSYAAGLMSSMSVGGVTTAGGVVATCQSIGATGTILGSVGATTVASAAGGLVGAAIRWVKW